VEKNIMTSPKLIKGGEKGKIAVASDHAGFERKQTVINCLKRMGYDVLDYGTYSKDSCNYPEFAHPVAKWVQKTNGKAILICTTGSGMSMTANKYNGVRAVQVHYPDLEHVALSRKHNDSNVLAIGARKVTDKAIPDILKVWLTTKFEGGRHLRRVQMIDRF
jgi:ribose 5-phosphate isomerase B